MGDEDLYLFNEGSHLSLYEKLGAHPCQVDGVAGAYFAVWAPNAEWVTLMGDFNDWAKEGAELRPHAQSGIWEGFVPTVGPGSRHKYRISSPYNGYKVEKAEGAERTVKMIKEAEGEASCVAADVSVVRQVETMVNKTVETYGRLDGAFNNAGIEGKMADTAEYPEDVFDRIIAINLKGASGSV